MDEKSSEIAEESGWERAKIYSNSERLTAARLQLTHARREMMPSTREINPMLAFSV